MTRFIELTITDFFETKEDNLLIVNVDKIVCFFPDEDTERSHINLGVDCDFLVKESVKEIKELIQKTIVRSNVF
jgi:hypothetical protein